MDLPRTTRLAKAFGIETMRYKKIMEDQQQLEIQSNRRDAFLNGSRESALRDFPELKPVFDVQDSALRFYHDVLIATPTSLNTNNRNQYRAKWVAREALDYLDNNEPIPAYTREGRHEEASDLKEEELRTLRREMTLSYEDNARVNPKLLQDADARYAKFSALYFNDEKKAIDTYPELAPLINLKKQASRYFKDWVKHEHVDSTIKDCLHRAIHDIARHLPVQNAEEVKADALALRSSLIGTGSTTPNTKNKRVYQVDLMHELIGRNGIKLGFWPYNPDLIEKTDRIKRIDSEIIHDQWMTAFNTQPKEQVLHAFPQLEVLYNKRDAARLFYSEKMAAPFAEQAASALILPDFDALLRGEALLAVSEVSMDVHDRIMQSIKHQRQIEGKDSNLIGSAKPFAHVIENIVRLQDIHFTDKDAANEFLHDPVSWNPSPDKSPLTADELKEKIKALQDQLVELNQNINPSSPTIDELGMHMTDEEMIGRGEFSSVNPTSKTKHTPIHLDALRSTAPPLPISHLFSSSHESKMIKREETGQQWDIQAITAGLNANSESLACVLLGEPVARRKGQLRFGNNKGSLIVTIEGSKAGQWFDHQTGKGGNMLTLIQTQKSCNFKQALDFAGEILNLKPESRSLEAIDLTDLATDIDKDKHRSIEYARKLANKSKPLKGTMAETYLKKTRGIDTQTCSDSVRFLPAIKEPETGEFHPALLVIAKNMDGRVQGVQAIFLDKEGNKLKCEEPKRSYGLIKGSLVPVHEGGNLYAVAEGVETALSISTARKDMTVFASLGSITNFSAMDFQTQSNTLIIFADHDKPNNASHNKVNHAADELKRKGFNVFICTPDEVGKDFNDLLREKGVDGVKQQMNNLVLHESSRMSLTKHHGNTGRAREKKFDSEYEPEL